MLRHGFLPPREIARPESGRIAIQGVQPKGLNPEGESVTPAGKIIASMVPFYITHESIGGRKRETPLDPDTLTPDDLYRRSEEHTSELQSRGHLVCRLLLDKNKPDRALSLS